MLDKSKALWTMVAENRYNRTRYHLAPDSFISFCGRDNLLVRDYVEERNGDICKIGESNQILEVINPSNICKNCLKSTKPGLNNFIK